MSSRVSLSELLAAGVLIRPAEAAAIVAEVCSRITRGDLRGVPSIHVLRVSDAGELCAEGPITAHRATVSRAAQLLDDLMAPADAAPEFRAPGPMRLALLRARGNVDLPPFSGLDAFAAAIARFAPDDRTAALRELHARWQSTTPSQEDPEVEETAPAPASLVPVRASGSELRELTISDIRRARRATGMTLREVSDRSRIPAALLRELEWGYLWNWPGGLYGRTQLVRYARAANLDERLVIDVTWPMLQTVVDARGGDAVRLIPAEESIDVLVAAGDTTAALPVLQALSAGANEPRRRRGGFALAAAAAAAIVITPAAYWIHSQQPSFATPRTASAAPAEDVVLPGARPAAQQPAQQAAASPAPKLARRVNVAENVAESDPPTSGGHTLPAAAVYGPAFSNEGSAVFFTNDEAGGHSALVGTEAAPRGTMLKITRVLEDNSRNFHAQPSPDGTRIAFDSDREGTRGVFVADQNGRNVHRISGEGFAAVPSWSPDGNRLAFVKAEAGQPDVWNLWVADLNTGEQRQVTFNKMGQPLGASWFPDGQAIAYSGGGAIIVQNLARGAVRTFKSPVSEHQVGTPAVSPDGRHIIFQVARDGAWLLNPATGSVRKVIDDPTAEEFTWSPDGHRVAFHSRRSDGWNVWVMGG